MITLIARYFTAVIGATAGFFAVLSPYLLAEWLEVDLPQRTCMDSILTPLIFGVTLGTGMALSLGNRFFHKSKSWRLGAGGVAAFVAFAGVLAGIVLMDAYGSWMVLTIPFLSALVSAPVYHLIDRLLIRSAKSAL